MKFLRALIIGTIITSSQLLIFTDAKAVTLFIDGMNTTNTLNTFNNASPSQNRVSYLIKSPLAQDLAKMDPKQINIPWSGDILNLSELSSTVQDIQDVIKVLKSAPSTKNEPINIVSHSFGTVLAYKALQELEKMPDIQINSFTTMGSPLGGQPEKIAESIAEKLGIPSFTIVKSIKDVLPAYTGALKPLSKVDKWTNLYADFDNMSGQITFDSRVNNIQIDAAAVELSKGDSKVKGIMHDVDGDVAVSDLKSIEIWHRAYYQPIENITVTKTGEVLNWNIPKDYVSGTISSQQATLNAKSIFRHISAKLKNWSSDIWNTYFGIPTAQAPTTGSWDDATTTAQDQTTKTTENNPSMGDRPGIHWGRMGISLRDDSSGVVHIYSTGLSNWDTTYEKSTHPKYTIQGSASSGQRITYIEANWPLLSYPPITSGLPATLNKVELGHNSYLEWGKWTNPNIMSDGTRTYYFDNPSCYIWGNYTTVAQMNNLAAKNISGAYTGTADGVYWTTTGGINLSGSFSADVNFNAKTISNFNISVSGTGHTASISNASGSINSNDVSLNTSSGQWKVDGVTANEKAASGTFYGPKAQAIGGLWFLQKTGTVNHAGGTYQGTR